MIGNMKNIFKEESDYTVYKKLVANEIEETRIEELMKEKHIELVQYLKEKYPEEFI